MGIEIEKKFLVDKNKWAQVDKGKGVHFRQGYIVNDPAKTIRVRYTDEESYLTIKGIAVNISRPEFEYIIPQQDAIELLDKFCTSEISKVRYKIIVAGKVWEVDEFLKDNEGLLLAEIELASEAEPFDMPDWASLEVTGDERYYNSNLSINPYKNW
jgi:adenylate cyclase